MTVWIAGLMNDMAMALRLVKAASKSGIHMQNCDRVEKLVTKAKDVKPRLVIIDWDSCEKEGFEFLDVKKSDEALEGIPTIGFVSQSKSFIVEEAQRAGCDRVYFKSLFMKDIDEVFARSIQ